jgi:hypothetical protein
MACPAIMINYHAGGAGALVVTKIVAGLYIARPPTASFAGINLAASVLAHPLRVIYRSFGNNSYDNITSGSSFNALVNSGIVHPTAVLICPFIAATTETNS